MRRRSSGFTLLEVLVCIIIITLVSGVIIARTPTLRRQTKTKDSASKVLIAAQEMRRNTVAAKQFGSGASAKFPNYGLYLTSAPAGGANRHIILYADCLDDDNMDGKLTDSDFFQYDSASSACGGSNSNGFVEDRVLDSEVSVTQLRLVANGLPGYPITVERAYVQFVAPQPSIWISAWNPPGTIIAPIDYGELEITVRDNQNGSVRIVRLSTSGLMDIQ